MYRTFGLLDCGCAVVRLCGFALSSWIMFVNWFSYNVKITAMGRKKEEESGASTKAKSAGKHASKDWEKENITVSAMLASMDLKPDKPEK
ncbi:hypothetical protein DVH24_021392 [Malus domestica]|uniref:Uncharacterized protein n=1 Tax=Malus domestica TaxID=3750 RepID=A0A498JW22_MALDO|nr:hypothetical protein DVH24_021392 [Malus domestica]